MATAIRIEGLSKRFRPDRLHSIRSRLRSTPSSDTAFTALDDLNLEIAAGSSVGLLGHNGSGKSTLLKCIAGILRPSVGTVQVAGRVAAMLELGVGFSPELTGRENVYLNGTILGLSKRDIGNRFDDIVAFAGVEDFIDSPVKHYSSGMYLRLGFAVAANVEPDILLIDEVLTVGDEAFQRRCIGKIREFQNQGRTVILVTHAPDLVRQICDRAVVLDHGKIVLDGDPRAGIRAFREHMYLGHALTPQSSDHDATDRNGMSTPEMFEDDTRELFITKVEFDCPDAESGILVPHGRLRIRISYLARTEISGAMFGIAIHDTAGTHVYGANTRMLDVEVPPLLGSGVVTFEIVDVPLTDGTYLVSFAVQSLDESIFYDWRDQTHEFRVSAKDKLAGLVALPLTISVQPDSASTT